MLFRLCSTTIHKFNVAARNATTITVKEMRMRYRYPRILANSSRSKSSSTITISSATLKSKSESSAKESIPFVQIILALAAGVGTTGVLAALVEQMTSTEVPDFDPNSQRYDQSLFSGRFSRMLLTCDPRLLIYSDEEVHRYRAMVNDYQNLIANPPDGVTNIHKTLWKARQISSAAMHPDTGEIVPRPFRMNGYIPFNTPVCLGMIVSSSTPALLFWGWVNQSQNAFVNYFNRNASSKMSNETLLKSYAAAVGSALFVTFGLATITKKKFDPAKAKQMLRFVAFPSSIVASSLNCYIVRSPEIKTGIPLVNKKGEHVLPGETSYVAAARGVQLTTASRAILQIPAFFIPPFLLSSVPMIKRIIARNPSAAVPITMYLLLVSCGIGLPASMAIFPQMSEIAVTDVEKKFQHLKNEQSTPYEKLYFNKGL